MKLLLATVGSVILLAGCASTIPPETPAPPTPVSARDAAIDLECADMVPVDDLRALWGEEIFPAAYSEAGAAGSWEMQATALVQDGTLACAWATPDSSRPKLLVLAMDDAAEGFEESEPSFLSGDIFAYTATGLGERSSAFCRDDSADAGIQCHWNVLADSTWLSFFFQALPQNEVTSDGQVVVDGEAGAIVTAATEAVASAPRITVERATSTLPRCEAVITPATVGDVLGVDASEVRVESGRPVGESLGKSTPLFGQVMWAYSYARLGYSECAFGSTDVSGAVIVAPGASWILDDPDAVQPALVEVADLGAGINDCTEGQGRVLCTVAVAVDSDLVLVQVAPTSAEEGSEQALGLVRAVLATG
ncbi:hypothetical protein HDC94_000114 [Leifsonia sp. AK011]|uniref:hypothetical protein n=1 Tax=Leifsonia sp. AK011 TaxID=2723075 RepID=UPI0015CD09E6|nr:hypothetical protein [Leifsonia sp. AK011]NYF08958.1 hypothetical protein [Leifsonia sp. AK011]